MPVCDIQAHLEELYGLRASPDLIYHVTDAVLHEVRKWQHRALDRMYPIVIFDALRVKIRDADSRMVKNKAVYIALGVTRDEEREVLGLWIADNEGAQFWLPVMNELRNRGVHDILIAVVDGQNGFPEAITAAYHCPHLLRPAFYGAPTCQLRAEECPLTETGSERSSLTATSRLRKLRLVV